MYIGDNLYTFSNRYLKINDLDNLDEVNSLKLKTDVEIISNPDIIRYSEGVEGDIEIMPFVSPNNSNIFDES